MTDSETERRTPQLPPEHGTQPLLEYFWSGECDFALFHLVVDTVLSSDYGAFIAKKALDDEETPEGLKPEDLAKTDPGPRTRALRKSKQELLEMFLCRAVDSFQVYVVDIIREVLTRKPEILSGRRQEISLGQILSFDSIEAFVQDVIESKVTSLSYEGFAELEGWCSDRGIPLVVPHGSRRDVVELIATRNLIVHNRGVVDARYLNAAGDSQFTVGNKRRIKTDEYHEALDLLNRIVAATDGAVAAKFGIPQLGVQSELRERRGDRAPAEQDGESEPDEVDTSEDVTTGEAPE